MKKYCLELDELPPISKLLSCEDVCGGKFVFKDYHLLGCLDFVGVFAKSKMPLKTMSPF